MAAAAEWPASINANVALLSADERRTVNILLEAGQAQLFGGWPAPGSHDDDKHKLLAQAKALNDIYPNGLKAYVLNARKLLEESRKGVNPYEGYQPVVPHGRSAAREEKESEGEKRDAKVAGKFSLPADPSKIITGERLTVGSAAFTAAEAVGLKAVRYGAFVLVAGGLGERLGYKGIKIELPSDLSSDRSFLQLYCDSILALQARARADAEEKERELIVLPLAIMTSGDTHEQTVKLLKTHHNFGMAEGQITIVKQELVPSLVDNEGHFALSESNPFEIETKPHGHGDVHTLLHQSELAKKWTEEGRKWVLFFQDTNGLVFRAVPAALGVSVNNNFVINSLTVARRPGEAVGGICTLKHKDGGAITINVEYNQLDPLLRATVSPKGDVPDETGFSPYPGNINVLVFHIPTYHEILTKTHGAIPEFVNPKYKDKEKTKFTKPTRLECMMQDFPKLLEAQHKVGFTQLERWISFSAVKNNVEDAAVKFKQTSFAESASSGESDIYQTNRRLLAGAGVKVDVDTGKTVEYAGIPTFEGAHVALAPSFGVTVAEVQSHFITPSAVSISPRSTLVVDGNVEFGSLELDGALVVRAVPGAHVTIKKLKVNNLSWEFTPIDQKAAGVHQSLLIRGYVLTKKETKELVFDKPGEYVVHDK